MVWNLFIEVGYGFHATIIKKNMGVNDDAKRKLVRISIFCNTFSLLKCQGNYIEEGIPYVTLIILCGKSLT